MWQCQYLQLKQTQKLWFSTCTPLEQTCSLCKRRHRCWKPLSVVSNMEKSRISPCSQELWCCCSGNFTVLASHWKWKLRFETPTYPTIPGINYWGCFQERRRLMTIQRDGKLLWFRFWFRFCRGCQRTSGSRLEWIFHVMRVWGINPTSPWEWEHTQDVPGRKEADPDLFDELCPLCWWSRSKILHWSRGN